MWLCVFHVTLQHKQVWLCVFHVTLNVYIKRYLGCQFYFITIDLLQVTEKLYHKVVSSNPRAVIEHTV